MNLKCIDLFSGAGGLSLGFKNSEFEILMHCEYIDNFATTYRKNIDCKINIRDITSSEPDIIMKENSIFSEDIDVIIGGPPCQGFSLANTSKNFIIQKHNHLVKHYIKYIETFKPKAFVMENVPNMLNKEFKFYLTKSTDEEEDLKKIMIVPLKESIVIGKSSHSNCLSKKLNNLYRQGKSTNSVSLLIHNNEMTISKENYYSKLCIILDKIIYIIQDFSDKNYNFIDELNSHIAKINIAKLKNSKNLLNTSTKNKLTSIINILRNQLDHLQKPQSIKELVDLWDNFREYEDLLKILLHYNELVENNIKFSEFQCDSNGNINTSIYSYNIVDYCEAKFKSLGYLFDKNVLNSANYGVPQLRNRIVFVGVLPKYINIRTKEDFIQEIHQNNIELQALESTVFSNGDIDNYLLNKMKNDEKKKFLFPDPILCSDEFITFDNALSDLYELAPISDTTLYRECPSNNLEIKTEYQSLIRENCEYIKNHVNTSTRDEIKKRFELIGIGKNYKDVLPHLEKDYDKVSNTHSTIYLRPDPNLPSKTVPNIRKSMWIHPYYNRALSIREAARLQSFPDSFEFFGTKDQQYQQIGNAVPPLMAQAIAEKLKYLLTGKYNHNFTNKIRKLASKKINLKNK